MPVRAKRPPTAKVVLNHGVRTGRAARARHCASRSSSLHVNDNMAHCVTGAGGGGRAPSGSTPDTALVAAIAAGRPADDAAARDTHRPANMVVPAEQSAWITAKQTAAGVGRSGIGEGERHPRQSRARSSYSDIVMIIRPLGGKYRVDATVLAPQRSAQRPTNGPWGRRMPRRVVIRAAETWCGSEFINMMARMMS